MKKISSFIPVHVINKTELIKELSWYISRVFTLYFIDMIDIITVIEYVLLIICKNCSISTKMRFEKQVYLDILKDNPVCVIEDITISLLD